MDGVRTREREIVATPHMPWFHSNVSREATERMLHQRADGTFLVRESTNFPGDYTLSMAYRGK
ncbi:SH2 domain protein, partial [Ancylostoma ceylanicum]